MSLIFHLSDIFFNQYFSTTYVMLSFLTYFVKLGITGLDALIVKLYRNTATYFTILTP